MTYALCGHGYTHASYVAEITESFVMQDKNFLIRSWSRL